MEGAPHPSSRTNGTGSKGRDIAPTLTVRPWPDSVVEKLGYGPRSMYVEMCSTPILGPTTTLLYRRLGSWAEHNPGGLELDTTDLAESLGLGSSLTRNSRLGNAVCRLVRFEAARWVEDDLEVRTALAPLPERHVSRLPRTSAQLHRSYTTPPSGPTYGGGQEAGHA